MSSNLAAQAAAFTITLTGQMYVAILIALVLGRFIAVFPIEEPTPESFLLHRLCGSSSGKRPGNLVG